MKVLKSVLILSAAIYANVSWSKATCEAGVKEISRRSRGEYVSYDQNGYWLTDSNNKELSFYVDYKACAEQAKRTVCKRIVTKKGELVHPSRLGLPTYGDHALIWHGTETAYQLKYKYDSEVLKTFETQITCESYQKSLK